MPKNQRNKAFPIFSSINIPSGKESTVQQVASCADSKNQPEGSCSSEAANLGTMEEILVEIKAVASRMSGMDESFGARLDNIDGARGEIKSSVASVENSFSLLSNRTTDLERRMEEAESRISTAEDCSGTHSTRLITMEKNIESMQFKIDDLENRGVAKT